MAGENPETPKEINEMAQLSDRVIHFLDVEGERIRKETDRIQSPIIAKARQEYQQRLATFLEEESAKIKGEAQKEADAIRSRAQAEADAIIAQARAKQQELIAETQKQAEKVVEEAIRECDVDRESVLREGQKQAASIVEDAKQIAARLASEATELARKASEAECQKLLAEARTKAHDESQSIISNSWQRAQQMLDSAETAYKLVRTQLQECVKAVIAADSSMEMVVAAGTEQAQQQKETNSQDQGLELVVD